MLDCHLRNNSIPGIVSNLADTSNENKFKQRRIDLISMKILILISCILIVLYANDL